VAAIVLACTGRFLWYIELDQCASFHIPAYPPFMIIFPHHVTTAFEVTFLLEYCRILMVSLHKSLICLTLCDPVVCSIQWHVIQYDHNLRSEILSTCHDMLLRNLRSEILMAFSDMSKVWLEFEIFFFIYIVHSMHYNSVPTVSTNKCTQLCCI
jgi:hypothetical protein